MKGFMCSMLADVDGQVSSKRFITLMAFFCVVLAFLVNVFMSIPLEEFVFDGMMYLVAAGLGFSTVEKFSRSEGPANDTEIQHQKN